MSNMRDWRKMIDEMFRDEIDPSAANRPSDSEYELCPVCNMEDPNCEKCNGEGLIDITGEFEIPDFSKMKMEDAVVERNEHARIKMTPEDLTDPDDDGLVERPESAKNVDDNLKAVAKRYDVEFVKDFAEYSKKNVKEGEEPHVTEVSENTMDKDMQEMLRLAGMYVTPKMYEQNEEGDESPLTNAGEFVDNIRGEPKQNHAKFDNEDGEKSVLSEDEQEWIDAVNSAMEYIDAEHELAYEVAESNGQPFEDVQHASWFIDEVARELLNVGLVGVPPVADSPYEEDPMASYYGDEDEDLGDFDDEEFYVDESGEVEEDMLLKPKGSPEYDDETEEDFSEYEMSEDEGECCKCSVNVYNEEAFYALQDKFGADLSFGNGKDEVIVPCDQESAATILSQFGFRDGADFETSECMEEDLQNGYGQHHKVDGQALFPSGATSNVTKDRGPAGAKHGDNPMSTRAKVKESNDLYESMKQAYRRHRLK